MWEMNFLDLWIISKHRTANGSLIWIIKMDEDSKLSLSTFAIYKIYTPASYTNFSLSLNSWMSNELYISQNSLEYVSDRSLLNQYSPVPDARSSIAGKDATSTDLCRLRKADVIIIDNKGSLFNVYMGDLPKNFSRAYMTWILLSLHCS